MKFSSFKNKETVITRIATLFAMFVVFIPLTTFAVTAPSDFKAVVQIVIDMIKTVIPLVISLTLLVFIWGIFQLVKSGSDDSRQEAIAVITYGIIGLFVMVSVWGLVNILTSTFFTSGPVIPLLST